jgi:hypothetical protein
MNRALYATSKALDPELCGSQSEPESAAMAAIITNVSSRPAVTAADTTIVLHHAPCSVFQLGWISMSSTSTLSSKSQVIAAAIVMFHHRAFVLALQSGTA